ncbi:ribonuclease BN/unknown domain fusion protein [Posidoniimonas corsicana]|uniref:Uncharacterized protein n=1 Tax=Posidoniimonas corsicana TaxID=1938618 RepID=A0A5C5VDN9_9BACT|nr:YihY/virulence factor BrkB family protein [Posidoniimonas corsicana]TWT36736.1 ribonuclease BN/unknown domain fusion protein [Posidoniimonas corsicana]
MWSFLKQTILDFSEDNCPRMAAALAYYTVFSLAPLLIIIIAICGFLWDPADIRGTVAREVQSVVGADGARQIDVMLDNATRSEGGVTASVLSAVMLLWGATGLVGQLQAALNETWEVRPDPEQGGIRNFVIKRVLSLAMILGVAFLLLVSLVLSSVLAAAGDTIAGRLPEGFSQPLLQTLYAVASTLVIAMLIAVMFKFLPDAHVRWRDVAVGALLTAVLFTVGKFAMGAYLGSKNMESTYGAAGSLALILVWVYYTAMIFLLGAEFTQVWAKRIGPGVKPADGAVKVVSKTVREPAEQKPSYLGV